MENTLHELIEKKHGNICQIVAMCDGAIRYEDLWHGFRSVDALNVMSVTKSVVSLLTGIAIDKGYIKGVDQLILDFFPDYTPKRGEKTLQQLSLRHLLTMTAPYKYRSEPWTRVCSSDDWTKAALDIAGGRDGISGEFKYSTLGIQILTGIIARSSGMTSLAFANEFLFRPLGIPDHVNYEADTAEEHKEFLLSKLPKDNLWFADPQGVNTAGWGLCLSARDMVKIGQLCLDRGTFAGQRILSAEWISEMTKPRYQCGEDFDNMAYGYLWWVIDEKMGIFTAIGDGGNVIYVEPEKRIVVGISGTFKPRIFDRVHFIREQIVPMLI